MTNAARAQIGKGGGNGAGEQWTALRAAAENKANIFPSQRCPSGVLSISFCTYSRFVLTWLLTVAAGGGGEGGVRSCSCFFVACANGGVISGKLVYGSGHLHTYVHTGGSKNCPARSVFAGSLWCSSQSVSDRSFRNKLSSLQERFFVSPNRGSSVSGGIAGQSLELLQQWVCQCIVVTRRTLCVLHACVRVCVLRQPGSLGFEYLSRSWRNKIRNNYHRVMMCVVIKFARDCCVGSGLFFFVWHLRRNWNVSKEALHSTVF